MPKLVVLDIVWPCDGMSTIYSCEHTAQIRLVITACIAKQSPLHDAWRYETSPGAIYNKRNGCSVSVKRAGLVV